jgi:hypothetical protein
MIAADFFNQRAVLGLLVGIFAALSMALLPGSAFAANPSSFGANSFTMSTDSAQAGAHSDLTVAFNLNLDGKGEPIGQLKDVQANLPTGFVGNPQSTPKCTAEEFQLVACKPAAQVGYVLIDFNLGGEDEPVPIALYNLAPVSGHLATLAGAFVFAKVVIQVDLAKDGTDDLSVKVQDLSTLLPVLGIGMRLWAVPAASSHDYERSRTQNGGPQGIYSEENEFGEREVIGIEPTPAGVAATPFLTSPTDCSASSLQGTLTLDSWQKPGEYTEALQAAMPARSGCEQLRMSPRIAVVPDTTQRDTPAGYDVDLHDPLDEAPFDLATPVLSKVAITLPAGTSLSPAVSSGLVGCTDGNFETGSCPEASTVGTVVVHTPLLSEPLTGAAYIGSSTSSAMYRIFISAAGHGVSLSLKGVASPDPNTGQLTITFEEIAQLPFEDLDLHLFGGAEAALANPAACGTATTTAQFTSYAGQSASPTSSFQVDADGVGGACLTAQPFDPSFSMGTVSPQAGAFSPFTLTVSRSDGQQTLSTIDAQLPPGLLANLSGVPLCSDAQLALTQCPETSQIGTTTVGSGPGSHPLWLTGNVYLTGPYKGAPFGLAIVVHAIAGPFDLGTIVIRAQILIDPHDLHLTIVSDPLPQIRSGIPLRIQTLNLNIARPNFMLNPTNCSRRAIVGTSGSTQGASSSQSTPFRVGGCTGLPFKPKLAVATSAKASPTGTGASFSLNLTSPAGQANIHSVVIRLPKQLQSRLSTLQDACPSAKFEANPSGCPANSTVGSAKIATRVLNSPLTGPVYLISHGQSGPPALSMVLHGEGITAELDGIVSITKQNVTRSAFDTLPDVPISSFDLSFPKGPHSLLGSTASLCSKKLAIPATIVGQNGAQIKESTTVSVSGCPRKHPKKAKASSRKRP